MISFARKPGLNSYWVTTHHYTKLGDRIVLENFDVTGYGCFVADQLPSLWELPFIKIFEDGDHMCALVGDNIQEGVAEFRPIVSGKDHFDQITDLGLEYVRLHPGTKVADRFEYWEPQDIKLMAEQSRSRRA